MGISDRLEGGRVVEGSTRPMCTVPSSWTMAQQYAGIIEGLTDILLSDDTMGDDTKANFGLSLMVLHELIEQLDREFRGARTDRERYDIVEMAMFLLIGYLLGLRGEEILKVEVTGLLKYFEAGKRHARHPHVMITLLGRFKSERGERFHKRPVAWETNSGLRMGEWTERYLVLLRKTGRSTGRMFVRVNGTTKRTSDFEGAFLDRLISVHGRNPELFEPGVDVADAYGIYRSLRRGSTTEAQVRGVSDTSVRANNRWKSIEQARGRAEALPMLEKYTQIEMFLSVLLEYSTKL